MAGMAGITGQKCVLPGMRRPEAQKATKGKVTKSVEKTERKVDKGPEKKEKKEGKDGEKNNTGGEAPKGGNREDLRCGVMLTAAGEAAAVKLTTTKEGETAGEIMAGKDEDKREERGQSEKLNGGNSSGSSNDNKQEKKRGDKDITGVQKDEEEAGVCVKYDVELTVIVSVEGQLSMMDLLLGIQKQCGIIVGCRSKVDGCFEITMKTLGGKRALLDGIREKGILVKARELKVMEVTVSFMHLPVYIKDDVIFVKLMEWGVEPASPIRRRFLPGEGRERIADGTRILKVRFNDKVRSLPYSARFEVEGGMEYFKIMHDRQTQVCRQCLKSTHIYRECPEIVCYRCKGAGHFARNCEMGRERRTVEVESAAEDITGADGGEKQEASRGEGEEKQTGGVEELATDVQTEGEEGSVTGCHSDEEEVLRELHGENGDGRESGTGEDGDDGGAGVTEEEGGPAEERSKVSISKKRKKKKKRKENNAEQYKKEGIGSESGGIEGRGDTGSDETSEPDGKRSYAEAKEEYEGMPVEEQFGSVKVEKGSDGERVSRDVRAEAAKMALRQGKRQMDSTRGEAKLK